MHTLTDSIPLPTAAAILIEARPTPCRDDLIVEAMARVRRRRARAALLAAG